MKMEHGLQEFDTLLQANEELELILNHTYADILIADANGVVTKASKSFERSYGIVLDALIGKSVIDLEKERIFNPSVTVKVLNSLTREVLLQETMDGRKMLVTGVPVFDGEGHLRRIVSYSHDVTEVIALKAHVETIEYEMERVKTELEQLRKQELRVEGLVISSGRMETLVQTLTKAARHDVPVLLLGESGVGKSLFAKHIHSVSLLSEGPFIEVNCGAIPDSLMESEFFGYESGAFTGASKSGKPGLVELAHGGTLFLDEVAEIPLTLQVKLLKVLQDGVSRRVGGTKSTHSQFRLVCATNGDIESMVKAKQFREDLFFRINTVSMTIPALRERPEDIVHLAYHFLQMMNERHRLERTFHPAVLDCFVSYAWPGNVRELEHTIERTVILAQDNVIQLEDLPSSLYQLTPIVQQSLGFQPLPQLLAAYEAAILEQARAECTSTTRMAELLGISQPSVVRKLHKYFPNLYRGE